MFRTAKKSVDSVLAAFQNTLSELKAVKEQQDAEADRQFEIEQEARAAKLVASAESQRASNVIAQFEKLIGNA